MNAKERFLYEVGKVINSGALTPIETYYKHDDWYIGTELWDKIPKDVCVSPSDLKELSDKPALLQRMEYGKTETVYRITKAGWKEWDALNTVYATVEIGRKLLAEEKAKADEQTDKPVLEVRTEKLQKIMDYVPWCKVDAIHACWKDSDGYWIQLNDGWVATRSTAEHTIHEDSLRQIGYQMGGVKKVGA